MMTDIELAERILSHVENKTTDVEEVLWQEPVENYISQQRFTEELQLMRRLPVPFCPEVALGERGSYVARTAANNPVVVVRDMDGEIRGFRNACRHRGMQVAEGSGCAKVFRCPYHGWAYRLDGTLEYIPHDYGFPDFNKQDHGLVPLHSVEVQSGMVFITQDEPIGRGALESLPELLHPDQVIMSSEESVAPLNWKLQAEGTLEGYHIKPTHEETFYPFGYDNLNVVETQGPNARVCFPFRRIEKLRDVPAEERKLDRMVTIVNRIFPFASVSRLADHCAVTLAEPESPFRTRFITYRLSPHKPGVVSTGVTEQERQQIVKDAKFLAETGNKEDEKMILGIQDAISSGANKHFTFGHFESAIAHLHKHLAQHITMLKDSGHSTH